MPSSTLTVLRRAASKLAGTYDQGTASATANNTTSQLECTSAPFKSSVIDQGYWKDKWLYRPAATAAADKLRLIATSTPTSGYLTPDLTWSAAPTSEAFEVSGAPVDPTTMIECVNDGLKRCWTVVEFTFTAASATAERHSLATAASWLQDARQVCQVGYLTSSESRANINPFLRITRGRAITRDGITYLEGPSFNTADTIYVLALKRAYDHCKPTAGAYGDQPGLSLESDVAPVADDWAAQAALLAMYDRLDPATAPQDRAEFAGKRAQAAARFTDLQRAYFSEPERTFRSLAWIGPTYQRAYAR